MHSQGRYFGGFTSVVDRSQLSRRQCTCSLNPSTSATAEGLATAEIFGELKLVTDRHRTDPLYEGSWT